MLAQIFTVTGLRLVVTSSALITCLTTGIAAQQSQSAAPTFRSGVDLVSVDVTVLDRDRRPVRGLTAGDFEVYDDGVLRPVETVVAVDPPPPVAPTAAWMRDVPPDVTVNTTLRSQGRLVVIVIDDGSFQQADTADLGAIQKTRTIATEVVNHLGASDLGAVVFTSANRSAQNFTPDRRRLLAAIQDAPLVPSPTRSPSRPTENGDDRGDCFCGLCSIDVVRRVSESLAEVSDRRKILFYVSVGRLLERGGVTISERLGNHSAVCNSRRGDALPELLQAAQAANVTIQALDPGGLRSEQVPQLLDYLRTVAENTGGRAIVNNNDADQQVPALFQESSSYYIVGFHPTDVRADGRPHSLRIRVKQPGLKVLARTSFILPKPGTPRAARTSNADAGLRLALSGAVASADVPLAINVAPFRGRGDRAVLAIVLGVRQHDPADPSDLARQAERTATVDVQTSVFGPEGKAFGSSRQTLRLNINPGGAEAWEYETLSRVSVPPGRYEVRAAIRTVSDAKTASVYSYVDVPDFADERLSLSGLVLGATPSPQSAPRDAFTDLMPLVPTTRREFGRTDRVTAFVRAHQQTTRTPQPAMVRVRVIDANERTVLDESRAAAAGDFKAGSMDLLIPLPLERFPLGEHLLVIELTAGGRTATRSMRLTVK
jgi:VWFA-related protein